MSPPVAAKPRRFATLALIAICALFLAHVWWQRFACDDAAILWRYSKHLAEGHGLRYNIEDPPVNGFSDLPFCLVMSAGYAAGQDPEVFTDASGLVLVSPLVVDVQEDPTSGRIRATVKKTAGDVGDDANYVADVHVKVIGSNNSEFTSGETDLRGVFIADAIAGTSTVIAEAKGGQYAFFRGKQRLGQDKQAEAAAAEQAPEGEGRKRTSKKDLLKNVFRHITLRSWVLRPPGHEDRWALPARVTPLRPLRTLLHRVRQHRLPVVSVNQGS